MLAALARLAGHAVGALPGLHRRRRHRQLRQDLDEGPARRGARAARARPSPRPGRSTTSSACPGRRCAPTRPPATWCWSCPRAGAGHIAALCRGRAAADRRGAQRRRARTSASSARVEAIARGQGRAGGGAAVPTDGASRCSTPTTRPSPRWRRAPRARVRHRRPVAGRATCAPTTSSSTPGRARFRLVTPARARRRWRCGWSAPTTSATRWPRPRSRSSWAARPSGVAAALSAAGAGAPGGGWRSPTAPTASRGQRRLQRQPRVDARRAARRWPRWAAAPADLGRARAGWPSSATQPRPPTRRSRRRRRRAGRRRARRRSTARRATGRGRGASADVARRPLALLRAELAPGDVVLVKASRAAGLDRVARRCWPDTEREPCR